MAGRNQFDDQELMTLRNDYFNFLDDSGRDEVYTKRLADMIQMNQRRLIVNINDLRKYNQARALSLLQNAFEEMLAFELALTHLIESKHLDYFKKHQTFFIGLEGAFGHRHVTPRTITSRLLKQIICVEGIVTKCSPARSKVVKSVHYCPTTKKFTERSYSDFTNYSGVPTSSVYPTKDEEGNLLETEYGLSVYKDHQTFTIQEMPEKAPTGQLPRAVEIIADNDLVDCCKPGDRLLVVGAYCCLPNKQGNFTTGTFRTIMLANRIQQLSKEIEIELSQDDIKKCMQLKRQRSVDIFEMLAKSIAPTIHGHVMVKKAILCMLLGGVEKKLQSGTRLRGDINILLIGDPSVAKSQMLRYVLHSAPLAIATTGRGSSGVGLTAAVVTDFETGDRRLEAGAMVLGDRGVVCIDEFDKMSDIDRTAIHEVMEQGTVSITKAGINARLNARCSVLAAANPVYGRYNEYKSPMENIGLQDSLLSRFDLIFILLDKSEVENDTRIAEHIMRIHRYRDPREQDGEPLAITSGADFLTTHSLNDEDEQKGKQIYEKYDPLLHGNRSKSEKIINVSFMKKYIHLARKMKPKLTQEACDYIIDEYAKLRNFDLDQSDLARTQVVTVRALETMIRLATAHAKARLSKEVELEDAEEALELVHYAYFKKVLEKPKRGRKAAASDEEEELDEELMDEDMQDENKQANADQAKAREQRATKRKTRGDDDVYEFDQDEDALSVKKSAKKPKKAAASAEPEPAPAIQISAQQLTQFKKALLSLFKKSDNCMVNMQAILDTMKGDFSAEQIDACLAIMENDNQVMKSDDLVILI